MSERNTPGGFWEKLPDKPEPAQPEAEALAREIGEAVAVTVYNSGDFDVDAAPAIPLIAAFLRRHDEAKDAALDKAEKVSALRKRIIDRLPLCPDHRDKEQPDACVRCDCERLERESAALREINAQSGQELLDFSRENTALRERVKEAEHALQNIITAAEHACLNECRDVRTMPGHELDCAHARQAIRALTAYRASQGEPKP